MRPKLHVQTTREVETAAYVGERVRDIVNVLKPCATERQRRCYHHVLAAASPPRLGPHDPRGMIRRVASFFNVRRGKRSSKQGGRPYAFDLAIKARERIDEAVRWKLGPLGHLFAVGQTVLTHNGLGEIARLPADGGVVVTYRNGNSYADRSYTSRVGNQSGSARLQHVPPCFDEVPRLLSSAAVSDTTKKAILDHVGEFCPTSPSMRDVMKRRTGPFTYEEKEARLHSLRCP